MAAVVAAVVNLPALLVLAMQSSWWTALTPEEIQRRGDAAAAIFREMKRRIAATK
jgi:hypothetical protein